MVDSLPLLMGRGRVPGALAATLLTAALTVHAQPAAPAARPDPLDPKTQVPKAGYTSSFADYRRLDNGRLIGWREANDTVARIGGWRVYAREAQQAEPAVTKAVPDAAGADKLPGPSGHKTP